MLYELIQSMSQSEKRYFKIYASRIYKKENRPQHQERNGIRQHHGDKRPHAGPRLIARYECHNQSEVAHHRRDDIGA